MLRVLTRTLVVLFMVTSLGAAHRPNNSGTDGSTAKAPKPRKEVSTSKARSGVRTHRPRAYQVGEASWYGKYFQGRETASGEPYNMFQFTAAHRQLPLGSWVKVTNLKNNRWVIVRINDRGPVPASRVIDLSYGAAQVLGLRPMGVARVRIDLLPETQVAMADLAGMN